MIFEKHFQKIDKKIEMQGDIKNYKLKTFDSLENFFEQIKKRVIERCEQLNDDYKKLEARKKDALRTVKLSYKEKALI